MQALRLCLVILEAEPPRGNSATMDVGRVVYLIEIAVQNSSAASRYTAIMEQSDLELWVSKSSSLIAVQTKT